MKKSILYVFLVFVFSFVQQAAYAGSGLIEVEGAIESSSLRIQISKDLTGVIKGSVCQTCEMLVLKITPATQLLVNNKPVLLKFAAKYSGNPGTAFFDLKTHLVTKIHSY